MIDLLTEAAALQRFLDDHGWRSCLIGGLANLRWGESRLTRDVDVTLVTGFGNEESFIVPILQAFPGRIPDADAFALANRVLLVSGASGIPIDMRLARSPSKRSSWAAPRRSTSARRSPFAPCLPRTSSS